MWVGATTGVFGLFSNGFLLCDHGLDLWDGLIMWEFNESINHAWIFKGYLFQNVDNVTHVTHVLHLRKCNGKVLYRGWHLLCFMLHPWIDCWWFPDVIFQSFGNVSNHVVNTLWQVIGGEQSIVSWHGRNFLLTSLGAGSRPLPDLVEFNTRQLNDWRDEPSIAVRAPWLF